MISIIREYSTDFYRLFYPKLCGACDVPLAKSEQHLCFNCKLELPFTNFETIKDNPVEKMFHGRVNLEFATSLLFFSKGEKVQNIMHNIKYNEKKELAIFIGRIFAERLQNNPYLNDVTTIIPVPLHPQKQQLRGYNQSELFAEGMNEILKVDLMTNVISRDINTETQTRKTRTERWENVGKAFTIKKPKSLEQKHILLIDDVLTTGATLEACAQTILSTSNCKVSVATIACSL